jgi:hypothetical protein
MKYLVTMELVAGAPMDSPQELLKWLEQMIIPTEEALIKLEADGRILAGGDITGRRGMAFIAEAASNAELSEMLSGILEWPLMEVDVTPLESFKERLSQVRASVKRLKAARK